MKLIKRTTLHFQEASSDKVYEIDLCQINEGRYVVNFRYGRRGTALKEGAKTTQPVSLIQAEKVFNKLVEEKTNKGYRDVSGSAVTPATPQAIAQPVSTEDPRKQAILNRLANNQPSTWKLERAIWRAGELKISEATPLLINLIGTGEPLRDYCIAWALGWCGGNGAIPALINLYQNSTVPEFVARIAFEALLKLCDQPTKAALQAEMLQFLPPHLQPLALGGSADAIAASINNHLQSGNYKRFTILETLYQIDNHLVRPVLIDILCSAPLKPNYFKPIRHIFKMAEYRRDAEVFGILAYAFDKEPPGFPSDKYSVMTTDGRKLTTGEWYHDYNTNRYEYLNNNIETELKSPNSQLAYSSKTRSYLRKRVWRTLRKLGEEGDLDYVKMAVNILLQYSDTDAQAVRKVILSRRSYANGRYSYVNYRQNWETFASYLIFNHILYENSPRYEYIEHLQTWRCQESYKPGDPEPTVREEAFPELWEQHPQTLLELLLKSNCCPVHHFAIKALRSCQNFPASINLDTIIKLLQKPYEVTAQFGFELALIKYNPQQPNTELVLAFANCLYQRARNQAHRWIEEKREYFLADTNFIAALVTSQEADTRTFARRFLGNSGLNDATTKILIGRIIAKLLTLKEEQGELAKEGGETLLFYFTPQLRTLGLGIINDLLTHPLLEIKEIGVRILLNHQNQAADLPPQIIESLLVSPYESLRSLGIRLFEQLPDEKLIGEDRVLIVGMAINASPDIRNAIKPTIQRLATNNPAFTIELASNLIEVLLVPEQHEGVHSDILRLLREDLHNWIPSISKETALKLVQAQSSAVQELGGLLITANSQNWSSEFSAKQIVKLANHEIIAVRQAAQQMFSQILDRLRANPQEMLDAVRILEAKWEDSREFAFQIFTTQFTANEFTPEVLVNICDSVRQEARTLGRDLLTRNFREADGEEYLLKLSEHPSADMQLFATNYLETYTAGNSDRLQELKQFFISILSSVNRGSVAKKRIFTFLSSEAEKSEEAAKIIADIMTRQSVTMAIADQAAAIQIMLKIHKTYPHIALPIQLKAITAVRI